MNILINAYACSPNWGSEPGMSWHWIINLAQKCRVFVITEGEWKDEILQALKTLPQGGNIKFYFNPVPEHVRKKCWNQGNWIFYYYYRKWQKQTLEIAKRICKEEHIDVIHQLNMIGFREPGYLWKIKGVPFIWGPIGGMELMPLSYMHDATLKQKIAILLKNVINDWQRKHQPRVLRALHHASALIAATQGAYNLITTYHKLPVYLINETGCEETSAGERRIKEDDSFNMLWVGRLIPSKQLNIALKVVGELKHLPRLKLHIVGTGNQSEIDKMEKLISDLDIRDNVTWYGRLPNDRVQEMMRASDILLFTSIMEGTPHVVLESIQNGLPIVCHDCCGFGSIVDNSIGRKIQRTNTQQATLDFIDKIKELYANRELVLKLSNGCIEKSVDLSWQKKTEVCFQIYEKIRCK